MEVTEDVNEGGVMDEGAAASAPLQEGVTYYAVHIPNMDLVRLYTDKVNALKEVKKHKKARFKPFKTRWEAVTFSLHGSDGGPAQDSSTTSEIDGALVTNTPSSPKINGSSCVIADAEKPSSFKGPKAQDLVRLRRAIESGDLRLVKNTIWDNPRYLVSSGDTPAILQEGSRYNALHVAAKSKNAAMAEMLLETVSNPNFFRLLYNSENDPPEEDTSVDRAAVMLDLYLNTPDKGVNETPLHFASKFGAVDVVKVLVSFSQCNRRPQNKMGHTPLDIVCSRVPSASNELKKEITALLENEFYVPVLRSADQSMQPIIGAPFSPKQPPISDADPTHPPMEIHAFAGPMSKDQAEEFRRQWRTPQRNPRGTRDNPRVPRSCPPAIHLKDCEKGLERAGRVLAARHHVPWLEYWPFLDTFVNLAAPEGLALLEDYLKGHFLSAHSAKGDLKSSPRRNSLQKADNCDDSGEGHVLNVSHDSLNSTGIEPEVLSPVSNLCMTLKALTIMDDSLGSGQGCGSPDSAGSLSPANSSASSSPSNGILSTSIGWSQAFFDWSSRKATSATTPAPGKSTPLHRTEESSNNHSSQDTDMLSQPGLNPFLYVERSLRLFAKRIAAILHHSVTGGTVTKETVCDVLHPEVKHIQNLVSSYMDDERFEAVGYQVVHSRIASSVAEHLVKDLTKEECDTLLSCLSDLASKADKRGGGLSSDEDEEPSACTPYRQPVSTRNRSSLYAAQKAAERCVALQTSKAVEKLKGAALERANSPRVPSVRTEAECVALWAGAQECSCAWPLPQQRHKRTGSSLKRERERVMPKPDASSSTSREIVPRQLQFDGEQAMEEDDEFYTPPSSPVKNVSEAEESSDEEMQCPDEGPNVFITGEVPTKFDVNVLNAISMCEITPRSYPNIYRWKHSVELYDPAERERWPATNLSSRTSDRSASPSTPAVAPVISADLSPSTPKSSKACRRPTLAQSLRSNQSEDTVPSSPIWSRITGPLSPVCSTVAKCTSPSVACSPSWKPME